MNILKHVPATVRSVLVPPPQEEQYFKDHNIIVRRLQNGATILGMARSMVDSRETSVNFKFPSGAWFDPDGKEGLHHLIEHLLNPPLRDFAREFDVLLNASTSYFDVTEYAWGVANSEVKDFGLWMLLASLSETLSNPLQYIKNKKRAVEREREIIQREIIENQAKHDWQLGRFLNGLLLDKDNPILSPFKEAPESLRTITVEDVEHLFEHVLIPDGLTISVLSDGKEKDCANVIDQLVHLFSCFPREKKQKRAIDWALLDTMNTSIREGETYRKNTGLANNLVSLLFIWNLTSDPFTSLTFSLNRLVFELSERIFKLAREKKWSYSAGAFLVHGGDRKCSFVVRFDIPKMSVSELDGLSIEIRKHLKKIFHLNTHDIATIIQSEHKRQKAVPFPIHTHLDWMLYGIRRFNRIIDTVEIKERYRTIKREHFTHWLTILTLHEPIMGVVGDLA